MDDVRLDGFSVDSARVDDVRLDGFSVDSARVDDARVCLDDGAWVDVDSAWAYVCLDGACGDVDSACVDGFSVDGAGAVGMMMSPPKYLSIDSISVISVAVRNNNN